MDIEHEINFGSQGEGVLWLELKFSGLCAGQKDAMYHSFFLPKYISGNSRNVSYSIEADRNVEYS